MMANAKADEMGTCFNLESNEGTVVSRGELPEIDAARTKYYTYQSANSLLKDFFEHDPPTHLDAVHQTTSFSGNQMIQFTRVVGLEVSLASFGMLENLLANGNLISRDGGRGKAAAGSPFSSPAGTSVGESVVSRLVYSLQTITESAQSEQVSISFKEHCSSRQVDEVLFWVPVGCEKTGTNS